jgi:hypothetical protein
MAVAMPQASHGSADRQSQSMKTWASPAAVMHDLLDNLRISDTIPIRFWVALAADHTIVVQPAT